MEKSNIPPRSQRQKRRIWPFFLLVICFLGSAIAGAMFASSSLDKKSDPDKQLAEFIQEEGLLKARDKTTVLIMGVDERKDDVGRSDTLMIATLDPQTDRVALLSIPRDTRVKIRGHDYDKINAAYAYGGEKLTENTVEAFLGIDIDHYVIVNTNSFVRLIDAIGGVDINVEKRMFYEDPWDDNGGLVIDIEPGLQHMDGAKAVTYVRYRDSEGDIGRVRRQQEFMAACMEKITSASIIPKIPGIIREVIDAVQTDLSFREILELAGALKDAQKNGLDMEMVPGKPLYIDGISYWIPDIEEIRLSFADTLGIPVDPLLRKKFERAASEYRDSIPSSAADVPESNNPIGNAVRSSRDNRRDRSTSSLNDVTSSNSNESNYSGTSDTSTSNDDYFENRSSINSDRSNSSNRYSSNNEPRRNDTSNRNNSTSSSSSRDYSSYNYNRSESSNNVDLRNEDTYSSRSSQSNTVNAPFEDNSYDNNPPSRTNGVNKTR